MGDPGMRWLRRKSTSGDRAGAESAFQEWLRGSLRKIQWRRRTMDFSSINPVAPWRPGIYWGRPPSSSTGEGMIWINYAVVLEALGETGPAASARSKADGLLTTEQKQTMIR